MYEEAQTIKDLLDNADHIVIIQPDNPDGDSLGSCLALEQILGNLGKKVDMVCGVTLPPYLSYMPGWDRVQQELPKKFDLAIIVDTSAVSLLENISKHSRGTNLRSKPLIVIDHHTTAESIDFSTVMLRVDSAAATAEVIYELSKQLKLDIPREGKNALAGAILSDTLGLTTVSTTARTVYVIAELVEAGVSLSALENARRDFQRKSPELVHYKGQLLQRIEYYNDNRIALLTIPWPEIEHYSPMYNPSVLALDDMRLTTDTVVAVVLKIYPDGKVTGKIRSNFGKPVAARLAEEFSGGGHEYASGFKLRNSPDLEALKTSIITKAVELLDATV